MVNTLTVEKLLNKLKKEVIEAANKKDKGEYKSYPEKIKVEVPVSFDEYEIIVTLPDKEIPSCKLCKHNKCYDIRGGKGNKVVMKDVHICFKAPSVKSGVVPFNVIRNQDIVCSNFERGIK